jgi:thiol-disulfide isomerase/thioredoxin
MRALLLLALAIVAHAEVDRGELASLLLQPPGAALRFGVVNQESDPRVFWPIVAASKTTVLVCFVTEVCPVCAQQKPFLDQLAHTRPDVLVLQVDANRAPDIALRHGITTVPHLVVYQRGVVLGRSNTGKTDVAINEWLNQLGAQPPKAPSP